MKIAIVKLSALGDIVHSMVVLQYIKNHNSKIQIDWIVEDAYAELLESNPDINNIYKVNIKKVKKKKSLFLLFNELKKTKKFGPYDLVIDMQGLIKSAIIARLIPSPVTLGFHKSSTRESIASIFYNKTFNYGYSENVINRNFEIVKFALELPYSKKVIQNKLPFILPRQQYVLPNFSKIKKNVILIPGASHSSKRFPVAKFAELTNLLDVNYLIVWGNEEERIIAENIKCISPQVNLCDKLSLDSLILLISMADLVIGSDTGPTHLAWAQNIPSITLFGPTPGYRNACVTSINKIIQSSAKVNPNKIDKNDNSIENISVNEILNLTQILLTQNTTIK